MFRFPSTAGANRETGGFSNSFGNYSVAETQDAWGLLRLEATRTRLRAEFVTNDLRVFDTVDLTPW